MTAETLEALVKVAAQAAGRGERDGAFGRLLERRPPPVDAVGVVLEATPGLSERGARVRELGLAWGLHALPVLASVAAGDPSVLVRVEAGEALVRLGASAAPAMMAALDRELTRGQRPGAGLADPVTLLIRGLCDLDAAWFTSMLDRVLTDPRPHAARCLADALAAAGRVDRLEGVVALEGLDGVGDPRVRTALVRRGAAHLLRHPEADRAALLTLALRSGDARRMVDALDAVAHPDDGVMGIAERLLSAASLPVAQAACRALVRGGSPGVDRLKGWATGTLPTPSPAWWALVEAAPEWCQQRIGEVGALAHAFALLPGGGEQPGGVALLAGLAGSPGDLRLRVGATRRLTGADAVSRSAVAALWVRAVSLGQAAPTGQNRADRAWAGAVRPHLEGALLPGPRLSRAVEVAVTLPGAATPAGPFSRGLAAALDPGAAVDAAALAGLLYDPDAGVRLRALVGLCAWPLPGLVGALARRAREETAPLLATWAALAAWTAAHTAADARSVESAGALARLESARPAWAGLGDRLAPDAAVATAVEGQLGALLEMRPSARAAALIDLSRAHRGRKLTRVQARELGRALSRRSAGARIMALLLAPERPGGLGRALVLARRTGGVGRGRRGAVPPGALSAETWSGLPVDAAPSPAGGAPGAPDPPEAEEPLEAVMGRLCPLTPSPDETRARVVRPMSAEVAAVLRRMTVLLQETRAPGADTPLYTALPAEQITRLQSDLGRTLARRWRRLFGAVPLWAWRDDQPPDPRSPTCLAALELCREVAAHLVPAPDRHQQAGASLVSALLAVLESPPRGAADLEHLSQVLRSFGQAFPDQADHLVMAQGRLHPGWRAVVIVVWLNFGGRLDPEGRWGAPVDALSVLEAAGRSALCVRVAAGLTALPPLEPGTRARYLRAQSGRPWLPPPPSPDPAAVGTPDLGHAAPLLAVGAGSLGRLDYPPFRVTARPGLALTTLTLGRQRALLGPLQIVAHLRDRLDSGDLDGVLGLVFTRAWGDRARGLDPLELTSEAPLDPPSWWDTPRQAAVLRQLRDDARAYILLRAARPGRSRLARRTLRRFWRCPQAAAAPALGALAEAHGVDRLVEGLVQAILTHIADGHGETGPNRGPDKLVAIRALRTLALTWGFALPQGDRQLLVLGAPGEAEPDLDEDQCRIVVDALARVFRQVPLEVAHAVGIRGDQGLPAMQGGAPTPLEQAAHRLLGTVLVAPGGSADTDAAGVEFVCRPLPKVEAVMRGDLGGDCSTGTVPFRCLSAHHTYYGIFREGVQQRGYITVFEAWATQPDGRRAPTLCLETINVPIPLFDAIQLDLVHILEAIARRRGLGPRLALVTAGWAWNYLNGEALRRARPARRGEDTTLAPADPWAWSVYGQLFPWEARTYSPFGAGVPCRLLVPTNPALDGLQPENVAEARRLAAGPTGTLEATAWSGEAVTGFISGWPT